MKWLQLDRAAIVAVSLVCWGLSSGGFGNHPTALAQEAATNPPAANADDLKAKVEESLGTVRRRYLRVGVHTPWQIMHGVLALGHDMKLREGSDGELVSAIDYVCQRGQVNGQSLLVPTSHGVRFMSSSQTEGHADQFLAMFAQIGLPPDTPLRAGREPLTIADLVREAQAAAGSDSETTWTLIALQHYVGLDASWRNRYGETYNVERLLEREVNASVESGACGGTHRLTAISRALAGYEKSGQTPAGAWRRAQDQIARYLDQARQYQNSNGCFSSEYFRTRAWTNDLEERLDTHGHTLEWVVTAVPEEELAAPWITQAVEHLCDELIANRRRPLECGALYHSGRALTIYYQRRWHVVRDSELAETPPTPEPSAPESGGGK